MAIFKAIGADRNIFYFSKVIAAAMEYRRIVIGIPELRCNRQVQIDYACFYKGFCNIVL